MIWRYRPVRRTGGAIGIGLFAVALACGSVCAEGPITEPVPTLAEVALHPPSDARAKDRFRVAAALENRELYDLAEADWASFLDQFPSDPLAARARFERGVCLFQLSRYQDAAGEFQTLLGDSQSLDPELSERSHLHLGLAKFNQGRAAKTKQQRKALDVAVEAFSRQLAAFPAGPLASQAAYYRAEALYASGRLRAAIKAYRQFIDTYAQQPSRADALYALGVAQREFRQFGEAAGTFEKFCAEFPEHPSAADAAVERGEALLALGAANLEVGRADEAAQALAEAAALPRSAKSDLVLLTLAESQYEQDKAQDAINTVNRLMTESPESELLPRAYYRRGEFHAALGQWPAAVADFSTLLQRWGDCEWKADALLARAQAQLSQSHRTAAEASLDAYLAEFSTHEKSIEARLLRASLRHARNDFKACIKDTETILAADARRPQRSDALHLEGLCEMELGEHAAAAKTLSRIIRKDPQYRALDRVLYDLAWAYQQSGDDRQATETFGRLAEDYPKSAFAAEALCQIGEVRYATGKYAAAAKCFWSAGQCGTDPELTRRALHKLAWCCFQRQQFGAAEEAFDRQVTLYWQEMEKDRSTQSITVDSPNSTDRLVQDAMIMIGECRFQQEQFQPALAAFEQVIGEPAGRKSLRQMALLHAGQSAAQLNEWQRSLDLLNQSLREFPNGQWAGEVRYERGWALYHLDRLEEAQHDFETVLENRSDLLAARAEFMIGEVQFAQKQFDEAVRTFFKVAYGYGELDAPEPFHYWQAEAMFEAARCLQETDRLDSARKLYRELLERYPASAKASHARASLQKLLR